MRWDRGRGLIKCHQRRDQVVTNEAAVSLALGFIPTIARPRQVSIPDFVVTQSKTPVSVPEVRPAAASDPTRKTDRRTPTASVGAAEDQLIRCCCRESPAESGTPLRKAERSVYD